MCSPRGYEGSVYQVTSPAATNMYGLNPESNKSIPHAPDPKPIWGKYFLGRKIRGIAEPNFLCCINGTMVCLACAILYHTLRAWQTRIYHETCVFKQDAVGGEPDPEPGVV